MRTEQKNVSDWLSGPGQYWSIGAAVVLIGYFVVHAVMGFFS